MTAVLAPCSVALIGAPDLPLSYKGGDIDFDEARAPHVTATLRIGRPSLATLAALDPNVNAPRIRTRVVTTGPGGTPLTRDFDLGLRRRPARLVGGDLTLELASDEALLNDYAPLADDLTPFTYQTSIRAIVAYALSKIGAVIEATPALDATAQTYADATNLIPDPSFETGSAVANGLVAGNVMLDQNDTSWAAHGSRCINLFSPTSADSYMDLGGGGALRTGLQGGKKYVLSAAGRVKQAVGGTAHANARAATLWYRIGTGSYVTVATPALPTTVGTATRVSTIVTIPEGATEAWVRLYLGHTSGQVQWDALRLSEFTGDPTDTGFIIGSMTAAGGYTYAWTGAVNASTSRRIATINRPVDAMRWPAGRQAYEWLTPLVQAAGFRLLCDENRKWTLRPAGYTAAGALYFRGEVNLMEAVETLQRGGGERFDAQVTEYRWIDPATGTRRTQIDAWQMPGVTNPVVNYVVVDAPYTGPGRSEYAVRRAQQRGRELELTTQADWTATAEQMLTALLDGVPIQTGKTSRVRFSLERNQMTVTTRTTDTPAGAIDLMAGTINSLAGTINAQ